MCDREQQVPELEALFGLKYEVRAGDDQGAFLSEVGRLAFAGLFHEIILHKNPKARKKGKTLSYLEQALSPEEKKRLRIWHKKFPKNHRLDP